MAASVQGAIVDMAVVRATSHEGKLTFSIGCIMITVRSRNLHSLLFGDLARREKICHDAIALTWPFDQSTSVIVTLRNRA